MQATGLRMEDRAFLAQPEMHSVSPMTKLLTEKRGGSQWEEQMSFAAIQAEKEGGSSEQTPHRTVQISDFTRNSPWCGSAGL